MRSLVVYESMFGNTHLVAEAIARGLRSGGPVQVASVADARYENVRRYDCRRGRRSNPRARHESGEDAAKRDHCIRA